MRARSKEITDRQNEQEALMRDIRKAELQIKQLDQDRDKIIADEKEGAKKVRIANFCYSVNYISVFLVEAIERIVQLDPSG